MKRRVAKNRETKTVPHRHKFERCYSYNSSRRYHACKCGLEGEVIPTRFNPVASWRSLHKVTDEDRAYYNAHPVIVRVPASPEEERIWNRTSRIREWSADLARQFGFVLVSPKKPAVRSAGASSARLAVARARKEASRRSRGRTESPRGRKHTHGGR